MSALALLSAIRKGLGKVPWQVWAVAALAAAFWLYGHHQYTAGVADENARWTAAQAKADQDARAAQAKRDASSADIAAATTQRAQAATTQTRQETAAAVEKVKYVTRTIRIPADCPALPDSVRAEGRAAVERANAANGALRARQH